MQIIKISNSLPAQLVFLFVPINTIWIFIFDTNNVAVHKEVYLYTTKTNHAIQSNNP